MSLVFENDDRELWIPQYTLPPIHNRTVDLKGILDYEITSGMGIQLGPEFQQTQLSEKPVRDHITP